MKTLLTCPKGHRYHKTSDCPTCPKCEEEKRPDDGFMAGLSAPARRALESVQIKSLEDLSKFSEKEILALHGMGKASLPKLNAALKRCGLSFKKG